jgi:CRP-like cAMP-binding protein
MQAEPIQREVRTSQHLERVLILKSFGGLRSLPAETIGALAEHAEDRFFPAGTEIYAEGEPVSHVQYVLEGQVELRRGGKVVQVLEGRSVVGGLAALSRINDGQQCVATADTVTLEVAHEDMMEVFEDNFGMLVVVIQAISRGLIEARQSGGPTAGFSCKIEEQEVPDRELTLVDRLFYLRTALAFAPGRVEALAEMASDARERHIPAGTTLWSIGDTGPNWYVLIAGVVRGSNETQEFRLGPSDTVGVLGSMSGMPRWFDAVAETDLIALELQTEAILDVLEDNIDIAVHMLRAMSGALIAVRDQLAGAAPA